jgi:hypothetical protein
LSTRRAVTQIAFTDDLCMVDTRRPRDGDAMQPPPWTSADIDTSRPSAARIYDYLLGGVHNFQVDRDVAERAIAVSPEIPLGARTNRAFLGRAVRHMLQQGIRQFLDLGAGIPSAGSTHEIAREMGPDARVVYVDNDPIAVAHSRAIMAEQPAGRVLEADLRDTDRLLHAPAVLDLIDFAEPVGVLLLAVLHFVADHEDPAGIVGALRAAMAPGSFLAISHVTTALDADPRSTAGGYTMRAYPRRPAEIAEFFGDFHLEEPGLVPPAGWRPDEPVDPGALRIPGLAGVARRP